jgi:hypothetical protein
MITLLTPEQWQSVRTTAKSYVIPTTGVAGVALIVGAVWGKYAVAGWVLVVFSAHRGLGSGAWVVAAICLKQAVYIAVLVGNTYFQVLNPKYVNWLLMGCIAISGVQLARTAVHLTSNVAQLEATTQQQDGETQKLRGDLTELNTALHEWINTQSRTKLQPRSEEVRTAQALVDEFKTYLSTLQGNSPALKQMALIRTTREDLKKALSEQVSQLQQAVQETRSLNGQLASAVQTNTTLEQHKRKIIETITRVCTTLQQRVRAL